MSSKSVTMRFSFIFFGVILVVAHTYGSQQIQMPESGAFMSDDDLLEQIERLKHNVSELWENFGALKTVLTETLNHLRVHQAELEETVHMLEHKHDASGGAHGSYTDDHHHHSGEQHGADHSHSGDSHSHGEDDHHHHSGEHHSHSGEQHSHGDDHSHGGESHSHGDDHSHGGESHSHGDDHSHHSWSHSHTNEASHSGHEVDDHHHHHGDSHEKGDDLQQSQQGADPIVEPMIMATNTQQHYHRQQQQPHLGLANSLLLINDSSFNRHHHHHHHHHNHGRNARNRTVVVPKFSEYALYEFGVCNVQPNRVIPEEQQQEIVGRINLWQKKSGGPLNIHVRLQGFDMGGHQHHGVQQSLQQEEDDETPITVGHKHGFHIHALGDLSNGCQSAGPHYNPKGVNHGGPDALVRHVGDLGNIECDDHGNANILFNDEIASLTGPYSIIGKAIVIHASKDDYGLGGDEESLRTGNAGARLACCVIEKVEKLPIRSYRFINTATLYQNR